MRRKSRLDIEVLTPMNGDESGRQESGKETARTLAVTDRPE